MRIRRYRPVMVNPRTGMSSELGDWMDYDRARDVATDSASGRGWLPAVIRDTRADTESVKMGDVLRLPAFEYLVGVET